MTDYRSVLERDLRRVGPAGFTLDDVLRRRDQKQRNRRLGTAVLALAVAAVAIGTVIRAFGSGPIPTDEVTPARDPFVGTWELFAHGSDHTLEIRDAGDGTYELELFDEGAVVCDGLPATETSVGTLATRTEMTITSQVITCSDGTVLTDISPGSFTYDPETDTLSESSGEVWHRPGSDTAVVPWRGIWPQDTREEAEEAQRRADAGDPAYTWQATDPDQVEHFDGDVVALRFVREQLGWEQFHVVGSGVVIRCDPGRTNPLYPNDPEGGDCAPTIDETSYETVLVTIEQLVRTGRSGIWIVTGWEELLPSDEPIHDADWYSRQYEQIVPPTEAELLGFVDAFLDARVAGQGAESYLPPFPEFPLLYATSEGRPYERSKVGRVEWGPQWPDGAFRVTVRLFANAGDVVVEQSFTVWPDEGGRLRLEYYYGNTTENGATVAERYGILGGQVTFEAAEPWFSPWAGGVVDGDESILVGVDEGAYFVVIEVWAPEPPCASSGSPATADELAAAILANPELEATTLEPVTVGGVEALRLEVSPTSGARICAGEEGDRGVPVVKHVEGGHPWSVGRGDRMRVHLLDLPGDPGRTLAILIVSPEESFEDVLAAAAPILDSFEFGPA